MTTPEKAFTLPETVKDLTAGTLSGMFSKFIEYPFDTVKVRMQTDSTGRYKNGWDCFKATVTSEGVTGIYRGIGSPVAGAMAENATLFWAYGLAQRTIKYVTNAPEDAPLTLPQLCLCGSASGVAVAHVLSPVERIKCLMQLQELGMTSTKYRNVLECAVGTVRSQGLREGLFKGHSSMLLREIPGNAAWYGCYEMFAKLFCDRLGVAKADLPGPYVALAGALGGCAYWSAFFPADVVGSRMRGTNATSFTATFKQIYAEGGVKSLYRGWVVTMIRAFPANAAIFTVYEKVKKELDLRY